MTAQGEKLNIAEERFGAVMARLRTLADAFLTAEDEYRTTRTEVERLGRELHEAFIEADLVAESTQDPRVLAELQAFNETYQDARAERDPELAQERAARARWREEISSFVAAYQYAEFNGLPVQAVSHAGWHPGPRIGAHTAVAHSIVLAYHDSGDGAVLFFREGHLDSYLHTPGGLHSDFSARPFEVKFVIESGVCGALAPGVEMVEVISENGTVFTADVVAQTFAATIDLPSERRLNLLRESDASPDDRAPVTPNNDSRGDDYETMHHFTVRVYDDAGAVLYAGPALADRF
ncbi:hypothetical protein [Nocardia sp. NPDC051570]|uniref:hypothetical protein n=1 Tax=Nocardia sp. NPDC051570 TaxID=3364324 RepID=UPI0037A0B2DA